MFKVY